MQVSCDMGITTDNHFAMGKGIFYSKCVYAKVTTSDGLECMGLIWEYIVHVLIRLNVLPTNTKGNVSDRNSRFKHWNFCAMK